MRIHAKNFTLLKMEPEETSYVDVANENTVSLDDCSDQNPPNYTKQSLITEDIPLNVALRNISEIIARKEAEEIQTEALVAVQLFYSNIKNNRKTVTSQIDKNFIIFTGKGDKNDPSIGTNIEVWDSMQNEKVRKRAIELCKDEGVVLELDY